MCSELGREPTYLFSIWLRDSLVLLMANSSVELDVWQIPPVIKGTHRKISDILKRDVARKYWRRLQKFAHAVPSETTLKEMPWNKIVKLVWYAALKESHMEHEVSHSVVGLQPWQQILQNLHLDTVEGLHKYVSRWAEQDELVQSSIFCAEKCDHETSDLGGWLADYVNTVFLVSTGRVRKTVKYQVVDNHSYYNLSQDIGPRNRCPVKAGDAWEQLCWHALENDRGAFILAVIWNTSNRTPPPPPQTQPGLVTGLFQLPPRPPAPPSGPPPIQLAAPPSQCMRSGIQPLSAIQAVQDTTHTIPRLPTQTQLAPSPDASGQLPPPPASTVLLEPVRQSYYSLPRRQPAGSVLYPPEYDYTQAIPSAPTRQVPPAHIISNVAHPAGLSYNEAAAIRRGEKPQGLRKAMRKCLDDVSDAESMRPTERVVELPEGLPWKEYIAFHTDWQKLVGTGIERMYLRFMAKPDHNRGQQLRLEYVVQRQDGSHVLLHPGKHAGGDAQPKYLKFGENLDCVK